MMMMRPREERVVTRQQHAAGKKACACIKGWVGAVHMADDDDDDDDDADC